MDMIFQISILIIVTASILITAYLFLKKNTSNELTQLKLELKKDRQNFFLPNRVEAYQRLILLLERISPNSLVMRNHHPSLSAKTMQSELLKSIREEFEHNIAQQIFISIEAWETIKNSKEEIVKIINLAGSQLKEDATSTDLAEKIFQIVSEIKTIPTENSIIYLKKELQQLF
jgi:hypothetical protein